MTSPGDGAKGENVLQARKPRHTKDIMSLVIVIIL